MDKIAKRLEDCRHGKNISQSELARKVGVTPQAVQKWEKAKTVPRGATLRRLADVLGVFNRFSEEQRSLINRYIEILWQSIEKKES